MWAGLLDKLMFTIPGVDVISGETPTLASTFRKNQSTLTPSSRKKVGPFHDSVFVYHGTEIGGVENGCEFSIPTARKWTGDTLKLVKVCRDMIVRLHAEHGPERLEKLPMLAVITAGL